eukprot:4983178-Alexandrium_andersonii.AAC.1
MGRAGRWTSWAGRFRSSSPRRRGHQKRCRRGGSLHEARVACFGLAQSRPCCGAQTLPRGD